MKKIYVATGNIDKFKEISKILRPLIPKAYELSPINKLKPKPKVNENGRTYAENALKKALSVSRLTKSAAVADDSGLEVLALGNIPGIRSARFAGPKSTYNKNNSKLLGILRGFPRKKRKARFVCTALAYFPETKKHIRSTKNVWGFITDKERGKRGFGYDPIFYYMPFKKTFAQVPASLKNKVSHRAKAFKALGSKLRKLLKA